MTAIEEMIEAAKNLPRDEAQLEAQRRSFAYGNVKIENDRITREMVDRIADAKPRK